MQNNIVFRIYFLFEIKRKYVNFSFTFKQLLWIEKVSGKMTFNVTGSETLL